HIDRYKDRLSPSKEWTQEDRNPHSKGNEGSEGYLRRSESEQLSYEPNLIRKERHATFLYPWESVGINQWLHPTCGPGNKREPFPSAQPRDQRLWGQHLALSPPEPKNF